MDRNNGYRDSLESRKSWCKWTKHTTYGQHCKICLSAGSRLASKAEEGQWVDRPELLTESRNLGKEYKRIAKRLGIAFTDASGWEIPTIYDGVHFTEEGHRIFAENIRKELNI